MDWKWIQDASDTWHDRLDAIFFNLFQGGSKKLTFGLILEF